MRRLQKILLSLNQTKQYFSVLILLLIVAVKAAAQGGVLNHAYSFSKQTYTVYELTTAMQQQADISISYDARQIKSKAKIRLPKQSMTTKELAVLLSKSYQIKTKFIGKHIILQKDMKALARHTAKKKTNPKPRQRILAASEPVRAPEATTATGTATQTTVPLLILPAASLDTISDFSDTFTIDSKVVDLYDWKITAHLETEAISKDVERLDEPAITSTGPAWYERFDLSFNVAGDEVFYLNPGAALHWRNFAIHGSYAIRGDLSHFRFGLSYTKSINPNLNISLWVNYGLIKDQPKVLNYQYDSIVGLPDSPQVIPISGSVPYKINGTVMKAGINLDWRLGNRLELFSGLSFNRSRTQIWFREELMAPDNFIPAQVSVSGTNFSLFPKILNLADNYSRDNATYTRSWVGFQIGLRLYLFRSGE